MSRTIIKIKGLNQEKTINLLSKKVKIYNFKREEQNIAQFEVDYSKGKETVSFLKSSGIEVTEIRHRGIKYHLKQLLTSYGLIFAIILSTVFYCLQYNLVLKIEVWGGEEISSEVKDYTQRILPSRIKSQIDSTKIENQIKQNFGGISSVSVAIIGQSLIVNLNESVVPDEMKGEQEPIRATCDGIITKINLVQGTLNVNEGDIVKTGDILVYPYICDSQGQQRQVKAVAEIYADVFLTTNFTHYDYQIKTARTGNKVKTSCVVLGNLLIYDNSKPHNFVYFEVEESRSKLSQNNLIPFEVVEKTYYELETVEINRPFDQNKDEIIEQVREKTLIFLQENEIIINENVNIREEAGCHMIEYVITTNRNIGG